MSRRYQVIGGGTSFSSGGVTSGVIPKENGTGGLVDSALSDNGSLVTSTEPIVLPSSITAAQIAITGSTTSGFTMDHAAAGPRFSFIEGGARKGFAVDISASTVDLVAGMTFGWQAAATDPLTSSNDLTLRRRTTANLAMGLADLNGSPVAQTISVQNAITGSNLPAANTTVDLGLGTGTGLTGTFIVRGGDSSVASGTTAQTNIIRCVLNATKALTSGAATTLVSIPLATLQMTGGYISVYMEATDGTNQATRCEEIYYAGENSAGVFVVSSGVVGTGVTACTATKTLTAAYALTAANPALLQVTPTLTGITATRFTCVYQVHHMGNTQPTV